jgi:hypothetical protein
MIPHVLKNSVLFLHCRMTDIFSSTEFSGHILWFWKHYTRGSKTVGRAVRGAAVIPLGDSRVIFILNEIWAQNKIYILVDALFGWNILLITEYRYFLRNISRTFCRLLKLEKYVTSYLNFMSNLFISIYSGGGCVKFMKYFKAGVGAQAI